MTETATAKDSDDGHFCPHLENSTFERGAVAFPPESESCDSGLGISSAWLSDKTFERRLLWKVDMHVIPWLFLLYLCAFIDRVNIGNAKIEGLEDDLRMTGNEYNIALVAFFIPYILCEFPSNIIMRKVTPSTWLSVIIFFWSVSGFVKRTPSWLAVALFSAYWKQVYCRQVYVLLSFIVLQAEIGVQGCIYVISTYYKRYELQTRMTVFFCASVIAGAFGGLLAYALTKMDGLGNMAGWRWIFVVEGIVTTVIGALSKFMVPDFPDTAKFLTPEESNWIQYRINEDETSAEYKMDRLDKHSLRIILHDPKTIFGSLLFFGTVCTGYSGSFFMPTIIQQMGYSAAGAQVRTIPIFLVATVFSVVFGILSDKLNNRWIISLVGAGVAMVGYSILLGGYNLAIGVRYFACFLVVSGGYIAQPVAVAWLANNVSGHYKRSFSSAVQVGFGNVSGIVVSFIFENKTAPRYIPGFSVAMALMGMVGIVTILFALYLHHENKKRDRGDYDYRLQLPQEQIDNIGDYHPDFRFVL
ncbi:major facilitator superfamily domain-containing protein [Lipomyces orientalis]|uniref:Major facilitator superfamily domain-containing protein n=1 Tax=Lipomyces orientalis TaxID=1233043 RepID=A0ACC3U0S5_9ASCO